MLRSGSVSTKVDARLLLCVNPLLYFKSSLHESERAFVLEKESVEKLVPVVKERYPDLNDDEILAMAERFSDLATFLFGSMGKNSRRSQGLGIARRKIFS